MADFKPFLPKKQPFDENKSAFEDVSNKSDKIINDRKAGYIVSGFNLHRLTAQLFLTRKQPSDSEVESDKIPPEMSFGLPVFTNLEFEGGQFQTLDAEVISYQPLRIDTVLMSVTMGKNIVKTAIQGRNGTVKEYVSDGDFEIDVKGVLVGEGHNEYPSVEVENLVRLFTVPDTLKVTSGFLSRFSSISPLGIEGIENVVVESFSFPQQEGFHNVQLFSCKLVSDTPIELTI